MSEDDDDEREGRTAAERAIDNPPTVKQLMELSARAARVPSTPDLPGYWHGGGFEKWNMMPMYLERKAPCNCLHWAPEPRYGTQCPNCGAEWVKWEQ